MKTNGDEPNGVKVGMENKIYGDGTGIGIVSNTVSLLIFYSL